jgi:hypothetical protein
MIIIHSLREVVGWRWSASFWSRSMATLHLGVHPLRAHADRILILDALAGLSGIYEKILWTATSFSPSISLRPVLATSLAICFA